MNRRRFLASAVAALAGPRATPQSQPPNILFLSVDDMNDWVGCLGGYPGVRTPNIDRLARRGVLFRNAHCAAPVCNPSRTALLTGWAPSRTGIYDNEQWWRPALADAVTIPQYFRKHGYSACGAGKVFHHVAGFNPPDQWDDFQLQEFDDPWYRRPEWYPWVKKIPSPLGHPFNGLENFPGEFDWGVLPYKEEQYGDMRAVDYARRFLARKQEKPFFLAIGLWHPHIPMFAPQSYFDMYPDPAMPETREDDLDDVPPLGKEMAAFRRSEHERILKEGKWKDAVRAYLASISFADTMVGYVLSALDGSAYARNTVIVFWSDNGWHLGEKQHWHKSTLWQRSTHVPLILAGPGVRQPGVDRSQPVNLLDLYPTLIDLCGIPRRSDLDGETLLPLLRDAEAARKPTVTTYLAGNHAVRDERWRYIRYRDGGEELYDLIADPNEYANVASNPRRRTVKERLAKFLPASSAPPKPHREAYDFDFATHRWKLK
ncbi:MAG: sulfatase [Bryobacteraceae bacterium]|nr:sulfatase [Bryobacteraceae bacterium]